MKHLILLVAFLFPALFAGAQTAGNSGTITASFSKYGSTSGDTTFFSYSDARGTTLLRFFYRHLRVMQKSDTPGLETGSCTLYFTIDTAGNITKAWCNSVTNKEVEKEVLRVVNKLAIVKPTTIGGKPVATEVMATIVMMQADRNTMKEEMKPKADIFLIAEPPLHKRTAFAN